jgi:heat shock protein HslJ
MKFFLLAILTVIGVWACSKTTEPVKGNLNATWSVTQLNGVDATARKATCIIKTADKRADGTTGCNFYGADISLDETKLKITFVGAIMTKIGCLNPAAVFESDYMNQLGKVTQYEFKDANTLLLKDDARSTLIRLEK